MFAANKFLIDICDVQPALPMAVMCAEGGGAWFSVLRSQRVEDRSGPRRAVFGAGFKELSAESSSSCCRPTTGGVREPAESPAEGGRRPAREKVSVCRAEGKGKQAARRRSCGENRRAPPDDGPAAGSPIRQARRERGGAGRAPPDDPPG